jgi:hypothetical protein
MHRGRQRSRKPVEAVEISISSDAMPSVKLNDKLGELKANRGNSDAVGLRLMTPSSSNNGSNHKTSTTTISIGNTERKKNAYCDTVTTRTHIPKIAASTTTLPAATAMRITTTPATAPPLTPATTAMRITTTTTPATAPTLTANANKKIDQNTERKDMSGNAVGYHTSMKSSNNRANNISFGISPGLGFSPKSVLQGNISKIEAPFHLKNIFDDIVEALDFFVLFFVFLPYKENAFLILFGGTTNRWAPPLTFTCRLCYLYVCTFSLFFWIYFFLFYMFMKVLSHQGS